MVTSALQAKRTGRTSHRIDKYFFSAIAILIAVTVLAGFARTYFLAGVLWAPSWHRGPRSRSLVRSLDRAHHNSDRSGTNGSSALA